MKGTGEWGGTLAELQEICRKQTHPEEVAGGRAAGLAIWKRGPPPTPPIHSGCLRVGWGRSLEA